MTPEPPYSDEQISAAIARREPEEISNALFEQLPMIRKALGVRGLDSHPAVDEVMSDLTQQVLAKLPRFEEVGTVPLGAWVHGFLTNILRERRRQTARRGAREVEFEDSSLISKFVGSQGSVTDDDQFFLELIETARDRVVAQPGGVETWNRMVSMVGKPERGRAAREEAREKLAEVSGLPVEMFGVEQEPEEVPPLPERVAVAPEMGESGFVVSCTVCGTVGAPRTIGEVMEDVRTHRAMHDREEGVR